LNPQSAIGVEHIDWEHFLPAMVLVMIRISGLMVFAPVFSSQAIQARIKVVICATVAFLLAPTVSALPLAHATLGILPILGELGVGLIFGLCLSLLNEMLTFAGQVLGMQFSFSLVNLLDPNSQVQTPLMGQLLSLFGSMVLLAAGLHRVLLAALMRSFAEAPLGTVLIGAQTASALTASVAGVFLAALELSAPVIAATLLVEVAITLMGRLSPQLPVIQLTVPAKTMVGYLMLIGSLALWPRFIEMRFNGLLDQATLLLRHSVGRG
jgi:flagellar biosynthetic protein FliR